MTTSFNPSLIIHTASLYYWFSPYEQTLDERIHAALDAGLEGVEISNGPSILTWKPRRATVNRMRGKLFAIHAELYPQLGVTLEAWIKAVRALPFDIHHAVFHPDELIPAQFPELARLPFPATVENMDRDKGNWRTAAEVRRVKCPGVGFTIDTAHARENNLPISSFAPLFIPQETHLSVPPGDNYFDIKTAHAMTHVYPDRFPHIPSGCPIVTLEGVVPSSTDLLGAEIDFVRSKL